MSDTSNESNTQIHQTDNRRVIGQGGLSAEGSNVTIVSNVIDGGAFQFGAAALNANSDTTQAALRNMANTSNVAMQTAADASKMTLAGARYAMDANQAVLDAAFTQTGRAFTQAYDAVAGAGNMVATAYADAKGRGAKTDTMIMLAVAAMGVVALMAVQK